ncbi:MAG: trigger factor [Candidatus Aminicenantes bacterium]|nr:trigger factor [Candidatus Aminicenantes bacterium]NIM81899.1 trigger factor [Candidatus Aminicenantes bacterium]NIN21276.1 trigger factor [Candidatus Aminicenantes bacterium]NIN45097.1 trigger factor [Candidatus Aminicenantes bacterium]NIN87914.1 trigger factor [Candidatus Aminicenantes bacterium]
MTEAETADVNGKAAVDTAGEKETGPSSSVRFTIDVPWEDVEKEMDEAMAQYAAEMKMPGFRKGKVPVDMLKSRYREAIKDEVVNKIVEKAVYEKIETDRIRIAAPVEIEKLDSEEGKGVKAEVAVEVFPTIELPELETIEVEIPSAELKFEDYNEEKQIDAILERNRRQVPVVSRGIKEDDIVTLKYQSKILQTKRMTPKKTARFSVNEKEEFEILDLYKELIGKKMNDSITLKRTYPDDYKKKPWAGKELEHYITIESVMEMKKPQLNEVFLKSIGFEDEAAFRKKMKEEFDQYNRRQVEEKKVKTVMDKLTDIIAFTVPRAVVEQEAARAASQYPHNMLSFRDDEQGRAYMEALKKETERSLRVSLITQAIVEKYKLAVSNDDLEKEYKTIAQKNNVPLKDVRKAYMNKENKENLEQLRETLLNEKVVGLLKETVKIKEV